MDFVERLFGVSPDFGSGSFEFALFAAPVLLAAFHRILRRRRLG